MTKYQEIAQILDANAIQNTVDAYIKGRHDMEKELNALGECEYNKGRQDAIDEFWTEFDRQIKSNGKQTYFFTEFLRIGMNIKDQLKEQNNG